MARLTETESQDDFGRQEEQGSQEQTGIETKELQRPTLLTKENQDFLTKLKAIEDYADFQTQGYTEQEQTFDKMIALLEEARAEQGRWVQAYQKTQKVVEDANTAIAQKNTLKDQV